MKTFFPWKAEYSVGIASIDAQHMKLVQMLNRLWEAVELGRGNDVVSGILEELLRYTLFHFDYEEKLFLLHGYPEAAAHIAEHDALRARIDELRARFANADAGIPDELAAFLKEWLKRHITVSDRRYSDHLLSRRVK